jgi:hypothetical protein
MVDPIVEQQRQHAASDSDLYVWQDASAPAPVQEHFVLAPHPSASPERWPAHPDDILSQLPFLQKIGTLVEIGGKLPVHADLVRLISLPNGVIPPPTMPGWFEQFVIRIKHYRDSAANLPCPATSEDAAAARVKSFCAPIRQANQKLIAARFMWLSLAAIELVVRNLLPKKALELLSRTDEGFNSLGNDLVYKSGQNDRMEFVFMGQWFELLPVQAARFLAAWYVDRAGWSARGLPLAAVPVHTPGTSPSFPHRQMESPSAPTPEGPLLADQLEQKIDDFHAHIADHLQSWLATLAGHRFDTKEAAQQEVDRIMAIVRKAGRQLMFNDQAVAITVTTGTRQQRPTIQLRGRSEGQNVLVFNSVEMPLLSTSVSQPRIFRGRHTAKGGDGN